MNLRDRGNRSGSTIDLTESDPLAEGKHRLVYQHPDRPDRLIKVLRPHLLENEGRTTKKKRFRIPHREGNFIHLAMDFREYLAVRANSGLAQKSLPISAVHGIEETTSGVGIVVEKVTQPNGDLAPTLRRLLDHREFDAVKQELLNRFFDDMVRYHVVVYELSVDNILYREDTEGVGQFLCVDGLGCRTLIPLPVWFKFINTRNLLKFRRAIQDQITRHADNNA